MSTFKTAAEILAADDRTIEVVEIPEWGTAVRLRTLSGTQGARYEELARKARDDASVNLEAELIAMSAIDPEGKPQFTTADVEKLSGKSRRPLRRLWMACMRLSYLGEAGVEEAEKKSGSDPSEPTSTGSA